MVLATNSGNLVATKGCMSRVLVIAVGPHAACFERPAHAICFGHVASPTASTQTVQGVVGEGERLLLIFEGRHRQDRTENLLLEHAHLVLSLQDGGLEVVASRQFPIEMVALAANQKLSAFVEADVDVALDLLDLRARHLWPHLRVE